MLAPAYVAGSDLAGRTKVEGYIVRVHAVTPSHLKHMSPLMITWCAAVIFELLT